MGLADWMLRRALGAGAVDVGLARRDREVVSPSYRRVRVAPADWSFDGGEASVTVEWGPFVVPVVFDRLLVLDGDTVVATIDKGTTQLADGTYTADITLGTLGG